MLAIITQLRASRKRAPIIKALEAEKALKRGIKQGRGRGRDRTGKEARG